MEFRAKFHMSHQQLRGPEVIGIWSPTDNTPTNSLLKNKRTKARRALNFDGTEITQSKLSKCVLSSKADPDKENTKQQ